MRHTSPIFGNGDKQRKHKGTEEQRGRGETATLLSTVIITGLLLIVFGATACNASSAATEPLKRNSSFPTSSPTASKNPPKFLKITPKSSDDSTSTPHLTQSPTPTPTPTATTIPTPSPTPTPSLRRLTSGGCCVQPFFSPDGKQVLFIDKPATDAPVGIYGVDLTDPQATPVLVNDVIGFRSSDRTIVATIEDDLVHFTNEKNGQSWTVDTGSNWPYFSPDADQILWVATDQEGPYDQRQSDVWLANLDGSDPRLLLSLYGGGFAGWFPAGERLLLIGRDNPADEEQTLIIYNLGISNRANLFSHKWLRGIEISPGGSWIAYFLSFSEEPTDNGVWVINTDSVERHKLDVPGFGPYHWRDDETLLYIPMRRSPEESMQLWAVDAATGQSWPLTDPASLSFSIANGDWDVSPDGRHVIFVSSTDQNIWLITLPQ